MQRFFRTAVITTLVAMASTQGFAGVISSGGGMVLEDSLNPWFLQNTSKVHYCLDLDAERFSLSIEKSRPIIRAAMSYWRDELSKAPARVFSDLRSPNNKILVGTREFVEEPCGNNTDLRFQLGVLSPSQRAYLVDFKNTLGFTVRTGYDRVNLRAAGFIYLAADVGDQRLSSMPEGAWSGMRGSIFYRAVAHELGHVFGIPDSGLSQSLMSYNAVQDAMAWATLGGHVLTQFPLIPLPESVLVTKSPALDVPFANGGSEDELDRRQRALGVPKTPFTLYKVVFDHQLLKVQASVGATGESVVVGEASLQDDKATCTETLIRLWLPSEQTVFEHIPDHSISFANRPRYDLVY